MMHDCVVWFYNNARKKDTSNLKRITRQSGKIIGESIDLNTICEGRVIAKASKLTKLMPWSHLCIKPPRMSHV